MDLFLSVAEALGFEDDRDIARLAGVLPENVSNWRSGTVKEFKLQTLASVRDNLSRHLTAMASRADLALDSHREGLHPVVIEAGSGPDDLLRQFRNRVSFDYLGHRFLYYEPQGALAWMNLISAGYEQDAWLRGTREAATRWINRKKNTHGRMESPIASALGFDQRNVRRGLDVIALGSGDGGKEAVVLEHILELVGDGPPLDWLTYVPVDVSIPLLSRAAMAGRERFSRARTRLGGGSRLAVMALCADFEEGELTFAKRLPTEQHGDAGVRLVLMLGATFGNLRHEDHFVRRRLWRLVRPGDFVWLEVGLKLEPLSLDPLYGMTVADGNDTSAAASRRLLLEGPFRRWEAAQGHRSSALDVRVWVREDEATCPIPGSVNFCHDLVLAEQRRVCTMLYSRRYDLQGLEGWLGDREFEVMRLSLVRDTSRRPRVAHLLLRRKA